jgi:UDP-2,3-diacylglucosamine pyrophosphatase LpxH
MNYALISDLHIGGDTKLDIFHSEPELANFVKALGEENLTLIINGDFIDFLAVEPFGEFSRKAAQEKIERIISAPSNGVLWEGFRAFLNGNTANRIDILLGNHDVEISFQEVQDALRAVMAPATDGDRIEFIVDRVSHQQVNVGSVLIHIEHGFQYDPYNWYDQDKLRKATLFKDSKFSFDLPVGSQLVYKALNKLTPDHPFVPLLKPETAAIYILMALAPREVSQHLGMMADVFSERFFNKLRMRLRGQQFALPEAMDPQAGTAALNPQLTNLFIDPTLNEETLDEIENLIQRGDNGQTLTQVKTRPGMLSKKLTKAKLYLLRKGLEGLKLQRDTFFDVTQADEFNQALSGILDIGAKVAIMGHSHSRKMRELSSDNDQGKLLYLNTGTWADLLDFDLSQLQSDEALSQWLAQLEHKHIAPTLIFTCARLREMQNGKGVNVSLEEWRQGQLHLIKTQDVFA